MSRSSCIAEVHRQSAIKKRGHIYKRDSDLREAESLRKTKLKGLEDGDKEEIKRIHEWFNNEMQLEAEYVADAIVGCQT